MWATSSLTHQQTPTHIKWTRREKMNVVKGFIKFLREENLEFEKKDQTSLIVKKDGVNCQITIIDMEVKWKEFYLVNLMIPISSVSKLDENSMKKFLSTNFDLVYGSIAVKDDTVFMIRNLIWSFDSHKFVLMTPLNFMLNSAAKLIKEMS